MKIDYITIFTSKIEESIAFYTEILGFTVGRRHFMDGGVTLVFLSDGAGGNIELIDNGQTMPPPQNSPVAITFVVEQMDQIVSVVDGKSIVKTFGPAKMPSGVTLLHVQDPNGVTINFVEMGEAEF